MSPIGIRRSGPSTYRYKRGKFNASRMGERGSERKSPALPRYIPGGRGVTPCAINGVLEDGFG
jgi:hypothetical protein